MRSDKPPPGLVDPIGRAVWNILSGPEGPVSKLNVELDKIRQEAQSLSDMNKTVAELNETLKHTNGILREFLDTIK